MRITISHQTFDPSQVSQPWGEVDLEDLAREEQERELDQLQRLAAKIEADIQKNGQNVVRDHINNKTYTDDEVNGSLYYGVSHSLPILAQTVLKNIDWSNEYAQKTLAFVLTSEPSDIKQSFLFKQVLKQQAVDNKTEILSHISQLVETAAVGKIKKI